ncbi:hypothetical protein ACWEVP_42960 [Amycolatopsis sp. NPDC003865]
MIDAARAAPHGTRPPRPWSDVVLTMLMVILTPILKLGGLDIRFALIWAICAVVLTAWLISLPHYLFKAGQVGRLLSRLAQQEASRDNGGHASADDGRDLPRIPREQQQ